MKSIALLSVALLGFTFFTPSARHVDEAQGAAAVAYASLADIKPTPAPTPSPDGLPAEVRWALDLLRSDFENAYGERLASVTKMQLELALAQQKALDAVKVAPAPLGGPAVGIAVPGVPSAAPVKPAETPKPPQTSQQGTNTTATARGGWLFRGFFFRRSSCGPGGCR